MRKILLQGIAAGVLAAIAGAIYFTIYQNTLDTAFGKVANIPSIIGSSVFGTMLIACGYAVLYKADKMKWVGWYNVLVSVLSFASILAPISITLPLGIASPELFPGLVIPIHFFPALSYFTIAPFFDKRILYIRTAPAKVKK